MSLCCCNTINCLYVVATAGFLLYKILSHHTDIGQFLIIFSITLADEMFNEWFWHPDEPAAEKNSEEKKKESTTPVVSPSQASPEPREERYQDHVNGHKIIIKLNNHIVFDLRP